MGGVPACIWASRNACCVAIPWPQALAQCHCLLHMIKEGMHVPASFAQQVMGFALMGLSNACDTVP